jgi:hypothetical protein
LYTEYDRVYFDKQNLAHGIINSANSQNQTNSDHNLGKASKFLVDIVGMIQEDTAIFTTDNNDLKNNFEDLGLELGGMTDQLEYHESVFDRDRCGSEEMFEAMNGLKCRVEELGDFSEEFRHFSGKQEIANLEDLGEYLGGNVKELTNEN